jgi:hypothetical protein
VANLVPRIPELLAAFKKTVKTDIPRAELAKLAGLADSVNTKDIRSYVFSFPRYGTQILAPIYKYLPDVAKIRKAVESAFKVASNLEPVRDAIGNEDPSVYVLNGGGPAGRATSVAGYLEYWGMTASAPTTRSDTTGLTTTRIVVYNGAESRLPQTIKFLESKFSVKVQLKDDPAVTVDVIVTTGSSTPNLAPPPTN